jgi:hypothetical protein
LRVILAADPARICGVETRVLTQAVSLNLLRLRLLKANGDRAQRESRRAGFARHAA